MTDEPLTAEPAERKPVSRWEDYIDVFFSPGELFARRAHDRVLPPLLTLLLLALAFYFVMLPANAMIMRASMAENPQALADMEQWGLLMQLFGAIVVPITYLVMVVVAAALLWLGGRLADMRTDLSRTVLISTYAGYAYLLAQVAGGVAVLLHGEAGLDMVRHTSFGVLRFVGSVDMDPALLAVLRRFELFSIWQAVIWAIGLSTLYRVGWARAGAIAAGTWLIFAVPGVIAAALGFGGTPPGPPPQG